MDNTTGTKGEEEQCPMYMDEYEIVGDLLLHTLTDEDKQQLMEYEQQELIQLHSSLGQGIRNYYRLWEPDNPYVDSANPVSGKHPDDISFRVIEKAWAILHGVPYVSKRPSIVDNEDGTYTVPGGLGTYLLNDDDDNIYDLTLFP